MLTITIGGEPVRCEEPTISLLDDGRIMMIVRLCESQILFSMRDVRPEHP